jgi:hypothetical protein
MCSTKQTYNPLIIYIISVKYFKIYRRMRTTIWAVVLFIAGMLFVLTFGFRDRTSSISDALVPGQYPINTERPEWSAKERRRPYRPTAGMGSDSVVASGSVPAPKVVCALSDTCPEAV